MSWYCETEKFSKEKLAEQVKGTNFAQMKLVNYSGIGWSQLNRIQVEPSFANDKIYLDYLEASNAAADAAGKNTPSFACYLELKDKGSYNEFNQPIPTTAKIDTLWKRIVELRKKRQTLTLELNKKALSRKDQKKTPTEIARLEKMNEKLLELVNKHNQLKFELGAKLAGQKNGKYKVSVLGAVWLLCEPEEDDYDNDY